ncbi:MULTISPECIES: alpha/beta fold hydrolase [Dietzia]|uniref:alpha/beta fold hydrolase n=1 Tax=Dietzia TaxID=37914 RepID=UPI0020C1FA6F|nr:MULTISPECIES: alpha/beta hydrolase [Dietzia]MCT1712183.1 alpha/beta hydrolase [Dietzia cinnamea]MCT2265078.1 alpha/beta hydrolase [Dietzia cinnamea]MCT2274863.1 alpha/beta hydrolase [Dietzia cinnamea]
MEPRTVSVDVPVGALDVLVWEGNGGAPAEEPARTVLALHGFPESAWEWKGVAESLAGQGVRVIAPMQRGYSPDARPEGVDAYAIEHLADDALAVMDRFGLERGHVLGHDWGACVAWWLAAHHASRVASLTAISVPHLGAFGHAIKSDPDQQARSAYFGLFRQEGKAEDVLLEGGARRLRAMFDGQVPDDLVGRHLEVLGDRSALTGALNWYRAMRRYELPDVSVPTTYLWGGQDPAIARSGAEATAARMTGEYRFVPLTDRGHWLPEEDPSLVAREVLERLG